jgi:hypothetical protein
VRNSFPRISRIHSDCSDCSELNPQKIKRAPETLSSLGRPGSPPPELLNRNVGRCPLFGNGPRVPEDSTKVLGGCQLSAISETWKFESSGALDLTQRTKASIATSHCVPPVGELLWPAQSLNPSRGFLRLMGNGRTAPVVAAVGIITVYAIIGASSSIM